MEYIEEKISILRSKDFFLGSFMVLTGALGIFSSFNLSRIMVESSSGFSFELGKLFSANEGVRYRYNGSMIWQDIPQAKSEKINAGDAVFTAPHSTADISLKAGSNFQVQPNSLVLFKKPVAVKDQKTKSTPMMSIQQGSVKMGAPTKTSEPLMVEIKGKTYLVPTQNDNQAKTITISVSKTDAPPVVTIENKAFIPENKINAPLSPPTETIKQPNEITSVSASETQSASVVEMKLVEVVPEIKVVETKTNDSKLNVKNDTLPLEDQKPIINEVSISLVNAKIEFTKPEPPHRSPEKNEEKIEVKAIAAQETKLPIESKAVENQTALVSETTVAAVPLLKPTPTPIPKKPERKIASTPVLPLPPPPLVPTAPILPALPSGTPEDSFFKSSISIGLGTDYFRIDATDPTSGAQAKILSGISPSLTAGWNLNLDQYHEVSLTTQFTQYKLQPLTNGATLANDTGTKMKTDLKYQYFHPNEWMMGMGLKMEEKLFLRSENVITLSADKIVVGVINAFGAYPIMHKSNGSIGISGSLGYLLPASNQYFNVKSGNEMSAGLYLRHDNKEHEKAFLLQTNYRIQSQSTSLLNQKEQQINFSLKYELNLW